MPRLLDKIRYNNNVSYYQCVIKDSPLGFWKLDESSGSVAYDYSGCSNNGVYYGFVSENIFPLVSGGISGTTITQSSYIEYPILKDYYGNDSSEAFATEKTSDNDFTLEAWVYPKNITTTTALLGSTNGIGIFWDEGNILFSLATENIQYTLPDTSRVLHIVAVYKKQSMSLYVDGILVKYKTLSNFKFSNTSILLQSGPCAAGNSFIIDAPAVYRYSLSDSQIKSHYAKSETLTPAQIVSLNSGTLFRATEKHQSETDKFSFPRSKPWEYMLGEDLSYDEIKNSIYLSKGKTYGEFIEAISLSIRKSYVSSKIEWLGGDGISVFISVDETNWVECENGSSLPSIGNHKIIYVKAVFESTDSEIFTPELYYLNIFFYPQKVLYAHNGTGSVYAGGISFDIDISNIEYPVLARKKNDGITCKTSAFKLNSLNNTSTIELIFTPKSLSSGYLFYNNSGGAEFSLSWASGGLISKSGIDYLYINGQDVTAATNISDYFNINESNYIMIKTSQPISGDIIFNGKYSGSTWSGILDNNTYKNIAIYPELSVNAEENYSLYMGQNSITVEDSDISMTESTVSTYSPDWIRVSNA